MSTAKKRCKTTTAARPLLRGRMIRRCRTKSMMTIRTPGTATARATIKTARTTARAMQPMAMQPMAMARTRTGRRMRKWDRSSRAREIKLLKLRIRVHRQAPHINRYNKSNRRRWKVYSN